MISSRTISRMTGVMDSDRSRAKTELDKSLLSVVVPIYNEEAALAELCFG
jgi:hypothetical protein